jgi:hypothetical protein
MVERVAVDLTGGRSGMKGGVWRYGVMERLDGAADRRGVDVLAFGFERRSLRLVVEGDDVDVRNVLRGLKVGTTREAADRWDVALSAGHTWRQPVPPGALAEAVAWAHLGPVVAGAPGVLASPWSSHRDLLAFRTATFYDARLLDGRVDPRDIHARCGGSPLPRGWPPGVGEPEPLSLLLRVAGAVLGVLPADRRCFRLFVHLARARGYAARDIAEALALTGRRVRQLAAESAEGLETALTCLGDPRLRRVP